MSYISKKIGVTENLIEKPLIFDVGILPVGKSCNLRCKNCFGRTCKVGKYLSPDDPVLAHLKTIGLRRCFIGGGEPFLHPHINDLINKVSRYFKIRYLLSNGFSNNSDVEPLGSLVDTLAISVDQMHEEAVLRQQKRINYFEEIFSKLQHTHIHNRIRINSVIGAGDQQFLHLMREKIAKIKVINDWHIYPMTSTSKSIPIMEYKKIIDEINRSSPLDFRINYKIPWENFLQILIFPDYSAETLTFTKSWRIQRRTLNTVFEFNNLNSLVRYASNLHNKKYSSIRQMGE